MTYGLAAGALVLFLIIWKGHWALKQVAKKILDQELRQIQQQRLLSHRIRENQKHEIVQLKLKVHRLEKRLEQETLAAGRYSRL